MFVTILNPDGKVVWARQNVADVCVASEPRYHGKNDLWGLYTTFADANGIGTRYVLQPGYSLIAKLAGRRVIQRKCPCR